MFTRKFILCLVIVLSCVALCFAKIMTGNELVSVLTILIPSFSAANAVENFVKNK